MNNATEEKQRCGQPYQETYHAQATMSNSRIYILKS